MMTAAKFAYALGKVESNNTPYGKFGDSGQAMGQWQIHPDTMDTYKRMFSISATLGETWDSLVYRIVIAFYNHYTFMENLSAPECAMTWHIGHPMRENDPGWDAKYNTDFLVAAGWIAAPKFTFRGMTMSPRTLAIIKTLAAFLVGYGGVEVAAGFRYSLCFDWQAIVGGITASGLVNTQSVGLSSALKTMLGPSQG
jgi:hypothetical protein